MKTALLALFSILYLQSLYACPITADFTVTSQQIRQGDALLFNNTSINANTYEWRVNGVLESTGTAFSRVFNSLGTFTITLTARNNSCAATTDVVSQTITVGTNGLTRAGLPVYPLAVSGGVTPQTIDWQSTPPAIGQITATTTNGGQTGAAYDQCGNLAFYALHTGSSAANNLFIYAADGTPLLTNTTANGPGLDAMRGGQEIQVIKVPQTLNEWYIIYKQWRSNAGAISNNAVYNPTNWLYSRVRYSTVTNQFTILQRNQPLVDAGGTAHTYTDGAAVSRTANGSTNQHFLYLCRRAINVNTISVDRFLITNTGITFSANTGNVANNWWSLGTAGSPIELSPTEDRIAVVTRNQDDNRADVTIFDATAFSNIAIQPLILGDLILQPDGGVNDQSSILATATEIDILGTSTATPLQFLRNLERKVSQIEFSPSGQYLYFVGGGYSSSGRTFITYLGQIDLDASPLAARLQIQTTPTPPNMTTGIGCTYSSCLNQWQSIAAIESSFDGNLYFTKRQMNQLFVIPQPNNPMPQNLVPSDIDLATVGEPNIVLSNTAARPSILPDQVDGFNYLDTRYAEVQFIAENRDCNGNCVTPYAIEVVDTNTNLVVETFIINQCPDTITFCADTTLTYNLREPVSGIVYLTAIDTAAVIYPDFDRDTLFDFSDKSPCPEICDNGIDDDGDGLIDCYDDECCGSVSCTDHFYNDCPVSCQSPPQCTNITTTTLWTSQANVGSYPCMVAGDMDGDGVPEIVTYRVHNANIYIIDGATGATEVSITPATIIDDGTGPAIADIDGDGFGELLIIDNARRLNCYEHTGALKYRTATAVGHGGGFSLATVNVADVDGNGSVEAIIGNQVYDALTGTLLVDGGATNSQGLHPRRGSSFSSVVVADLLPDNYCLNCKGLELVAGNQVFSIDLATSTIRVEMQAGASKRDGFTSIADMDGDGDLDAVVQTANVANNLREIYCWDIQTSQIMRQFTYPDYRIGASRANIADMDGDGELELSFCGYPQFYALDNDFTVLWSQPTNDGSAVTNSTVFDFCGDGTAEVIYRNSSNLIIYDGTTGNILHQTACRSSTHIENPLIVDINGDGLTEIVTTCGSGTTGNVVAYGSNSFPWVGSRTVWNQHAYYSVHVNEDLTIPTVQQAHQIIGDSLILNTFLNQYSNPQFATPDATVSIVSANNDVIDSTTLQVQVCNIGDSRLSGTTPIAFYATDPTSTNANLIQSIQALGTNIEPGQCQLLTYRVRAVNGDVFAVVNCDNSIPPIYDFNTDFPMTAIGECDYTNNMASRPVVTLLSIGGLSFDATRVQNTSYLTWEFISPGASSKYELIQIERSQDAIQFEILESSLVTSAKAYTDEYPLEGTNYYRLWVLDKSTGQYFYTVIKAVVFPSQTPQIRAYPNPFDANIQVQLVNIGNTENVQIILIDALGRVVHQQFFDEVIGNTILDLNLNQSLAKGHYILKVNYNAQTYYQKMIK